jgi:hypothetical protein
VSGGGGAAERSHGLKLNYNIRLYSIRIMMAPKLLGPRRMVIVRDDGTARLMGSLIPVFFKPRLTRSASIG